MRRSVAASLAVLLFASFGVQGQPAMPHGICVQQDRIGDWAVLSDTKLIVVDKGGKKFRLTLSGACSSLQLQTTLAFRPAGTDTCLARNDGVVASLPGYPETPERCLITDIDEYTAAMENADQIAEGTLYHHPDTHGEIGAIR